MKQPVNVMKLVDLSELPVSTLGRPTKKSKYKDLCDTLVSTGKAAVVSYRNLREMKKNKHSMVCSLYRMIGRSYKIRTVTKGTIVYIWLVHKTKDELHTIDTQEVTCQ